MSFPFGLLLFSIALLIGHAEAGCDKGWTAYNGHCWMVGAEMQKSQSAADAVCHKSNAQLVSIHSEDENKTCESVPSKRLWGSFWLGLKITRVAGSEKAISCHWIDGSEMGYGNVKEVNAGQGPWGHFAGQEPEPNNNLGKEACVVFSMDNPTAKKSGWWDMTCENEKAFAFPICKK